MPRSSKAIGRQNRRAERRKKNNDIHNSTNNLISLEQKHHVAPQRYKVEPLEALTDAMADLGDAIDRSRIIFGVGPAGTGKTYYPARRAAMALKSGEIKKLYLTRPAVESGEKLGFLPGDIDEKIEPYLAPFYDGFVDELGKGHMDYLIEKKIIEAIPLGFWRGRTVKDAWLLADEMQNATKNQFRMLLTRMGRNSKMIFNGDVRQLDIPSDQSGLADAMYRLKSVNDIEIIRFSIEDIVRDDIVADIIRAYDE